MHGTIKTYYPSGKIYSETPRVCGILDGIVRKYYESGVLLSETPYLNGEPQPGLKEFDKRGKQLESYKLVFTEKIARHSNGLDVTLEVEVSPKVRNVSFFQKIITEEAGEIFVPLPIKEKRGELVVTVPAGAFIDKEIVIKSDFATRYNNRGILIEPYNLKVNN